MEIFLNGRLSILGILDLGGETVYFDMIYAFQIQRLKLIFKPDLSDTSLHVIDTPETISDELRDAGFPKDTKFARMPLFTFRIIIRRG